MTRVYTKKTPEQRPMCSREGCERRSWARGICNTHYRQWLYNTTLPKPVMAIDLVLQCMPGTISQLQQESGLNRATVELRVVELHKGTPKRIYVEDWVQGGPNGDRKLVAVFAAGDLEDVAKPSPLQRRKARKAKNRASYALRKKIKQGEELVNALFGPRKPTNKSGEQKA